jgi:hypothetical protein
LLWLQQGVALLNFDALIATGTVAELHQTVVIPIFGIEYWAVISDG